MTGEADRDAAMGTSRARSDCAARSDSAARSTSGARSDSAARLSAKRLLDVGVSVFLLALTSPLIVCVAILIKVESRGPVFFRCRRVGRGGRDFAMLKFRKMHHGADGVALTIYDDTRFTRIGRSLAHTKLDELPQLWNVLRGQMSLVGPRPEDPKFVALLPNAYEKILEVHPGVTGFAQLAFANESKILDPDDRIGHYVRSLLPQKASLDQMYVERASVGLDLKILYWTSLCVLGRRSVAVNRQTGAIGARRRPLLRVDVPLEQVDP
jgi:lipopolysaccharide/colanic/teichoic acid biosynthesis glycosyltransferase